MSLNAMKSAASLKTQLRVQAKCLGCEIDWDMWDVAAPEFHRFAATGTHWVVFQPQTPRRLDPPYYPAEAIIAALEGALDDLSDGLEPCPPDCECRDEGDCHEG